MAERTWCPSLGTQCDAASPHAAGTDFPADAKMPQPFLTKTSAKHVAAVAASSGASAKAISGDLSLSFQRHFQRFDAAVVASNVNRLHWPTSANVTALQFGSVLVPRDAAVCLSREALQDTPIQASLLALPNDSISDLISLIVRRSTGKSDGSSADMLTGLIGLPSTCHVTTMSAVFDSLVCSKPFLKRVRQLTLCDATSGDEASALTKFARSATSLEDLSLINCTLRSDIVATIEVLKDREVKYLNLERSSLGCSPADAEREAVLAALAAHLKVNKFLVSLNLSYTNLDAEAVSSLMNALAESDTQMLPQDMSDRAPDAFDPSTLGGRVDPTAFLGATRKASDDGSQGEEAEETEESLASSRVASEDGSADSDVDEEDEEDEEEEAANKEGKPSHLTVSAEKEKKKRERERLQTERRQQRERHRQVKELLQREDSERRVLVEEYLSGVREVVLGSSARIAKRYGEEKQKAEELYCLRRSGWSRLQALVLRGNRLGDTGAKQVALVLREEVPLTEDEARERQEAADTLRGNLGAALGAGRIAVSVDEAKARGVLQQMAQSEFAAICARGNAGSVVAADAEEEEDEYAKEAPSVVMTNVENCRDSGGGEDEATPNEDDGAVQLLAEEKRRWEEWAAEGLPQVTVAPMKKGMRSITLLDLGSCHIGRSGLEALAEALRTNTTLESLCLRHNPIGGITAAQPKASHGDPDSAMPASFTSFVEMLCMNKSLHTLDLGYCQLGAEHVRTLAATLRVNNVLCTLGLEGNQLGADEAYQQKKYDHSYLYDLWMAVAQPGCALRHLHMSHNSIALCLWSEEADALAAVCGQVSSLSLAHVGLQESHLRLWSEALQRSSGAHGPTVRALQLARNELAGGAGGAALGSLLKHFTVLEELSLDEHPLLGSAGVAAALEHLSTTLRRLGCCGTGLTAAFVGAVQSPVIPPVVAEQLTSLNLGDVEAPTSGALRSWTTYLADSLKSIQFLSLWARGMAGKENEVVPLFVSLVRTCSSLLYVDCGFPPQFRSSMSGGAHLTELERILVPRRMVLSRKLSNHPTDIVSRSG